jgi:uncharacterized delta-60 repeat protein
MISFVSARRRSRRAGAIPAAAEGIEPRRLLAASGLDPSFAGGEGWVDGGARAVAVQPDGRIVVVTDGFELTRLRPDGTPDMSFRAGRWFRVDFGSGEVGGDVTILPDGDILVVGGASVEDNDPYRFAAARFNADGTPDRSFGGGDGLAVANLADAFGDIAHAVVALPDGDLLLAGVRGDPGSGDFLVVRMNRDGSLDRSFGGGDGAAVLDFGGSELATAIAVVPDGDIVVSGSYLTEGEYDGDSGLTGYEGGAAVARLKPTGAPDRTFGGGDGKATVRSVEGSAFFDRMPEGLGGAMLVLPDGRLVVAHAPDTYTAAVARLTSSGGTDRSFSGGVVIVDRGAEGSSSALAMMPDGSLLVGGAGVKRVLPDGRLDPGFGGRDGVAASWTRDMAAQPDGKVVVLAATGIYRLLGSFTGNADPDDALPEARPLRPGGPAARDSAGPVDVDFYRFDARAGQRVGIDVDRGGGGALDAHLRVFAADGTELATNGNGRAPGEAASGDPYVEFTAPAAGTYYVGVSSRGNVFYDPRANGDSDRGQTSGAYAITLADRTGASPPPGSLDGTFGGGDGIVTTTLAGQAYGFDALALPDGRVVAFAQTRGPGGERLAVVRYLPDGSPDRSFGGGDGAAEVDVPRQTGEFMDDWSYSFASAAPAPGGGFVIVGTWSDFWTGGADVAVVRLKADGSLDRSFGGDGVVTADVGDWDWGRDAAVLPDGDVLVAGDSGNYYEPLLTLLRFDRDGGLDRGFGRRGVARAAEPSHGNAVAVLPDGDVLVGGARSSLECYYECAEFSDGFLLARFDSDGTPDPGFGTAGVARTEFGEGPSAMVVLPDGKVLLAGTERRADNFQTDFALARFRADGRLDAGFGGGDGTVTTDLGADEQVSDLAVLADGRLVLGGTSFSDVGGESPPTDFLLVGYRPDGTPDATFGEGGVVTTDVRGNHDRVDTLLALPGDRLLVAGSTAAKYLAEPINEWLSDLALARYVAAPGAAPPADGDRDDTIAEAVRTAVGRTASGRTIGYTRDVDVYRFKVRAGERVAFEVSRAGGGRLDAYLRVFDGGGRELAAGNGPRLQQTFARAGIYYVAVSGRGNRSYDVVSGAGKTPGSTGGYSLRLTETAAVGTAAPAAGGGVRASATRDVLGEHGGSCDCGG